MGGTKLLETPGEKPPELSCSKTHPTPARPLQGFLQHEGAQTETNDPHDSIHTVPLWKL